MDLVFLIWIRFGISKFYVFLIQYLFFISLHLFVYKGKTKTTTIKRDRLYRLEIF